MGKGYLAGIYWHEEFHSARKKEKTADCIYLTSDRVCQNNRSPYYLSKCFIATTCPLRVRNGEEERPKKAAKRKATAPPVEKKAKKVSQCSLPLGCEVKHKLLGTGYYRGFNPENATINIEFESKTSRFPYPQAITDGHLKTDDVYLEMVMDDIDNA